MIISATYSDLVRGKNAPILYQGDMRELFSEISQDGFEGVEIHTADAGRMNVAVVKKMLSDNNLKLTSVGTGLARQIDGLTLSADDEICQKKAVLRLNGYIDFASEFENVVVIIGLLRGKISNCVSKKAFWDRLEKNLLICAEHARKREVTLAFEMINRYEADSLHSAAEGMAFLRKLGHPAIGIHLDTYHMNIEESDIEKAIMDSSDKLIHVHVADNDRCYPGHGHFDFGKLCEILQEVSYSGALAVEALPYPDQGTAGRKSANCLQKFIR